MNSIIVKLTIPLIVICSSINYESINSLYKWGEKNNIYFHKNLKLNPIDSEHHLPYFTVTEEIENNTIILSIPSKMLMNSSNMLHYLKSKKYKKLYNDLQNITNPYLRMNSTKDLFFISIGIYTSLYKNNDNQLNILFKDYLDFYENLAMENFPINYTPEEVNFLYGTQFGRKLMTAKDSIENEIDIAQNILNYKIINQDLFSKYRVLAVSNSIKLNGSTTVTPLIDLFIHGGDDIANINYKYNMEKDCVDLVTINTIHKDKLAIIKALNLPNSQYLLYYGYTIKDNVLSDNFFVDLLVYGFQKELKVENETFDTNITTYDLSRNSFINDSIDDYIKIASKIDKYAQMKNIGGLVLLKDNLAFILKYYEQFTINNYKIIFNSQKIINDIKRVIDFEIQELKDRIHLLNNEIDKIQKMKKDL